MTIIDLHSHWGTERGYPLRTPEERALQEKVWRSTPSFVTEAEMAAYLRESRVQAILDFGFTKTLPISEVRPLHDYALAVQRAHPDVVRGIWVQVDPRAGKEGVAELRRCVDAGAGFVGFCVSGTAAGFPATDPVWEPFYRLCLAARLPVLILAGFTGTGAGFPGGKGMLLEHCHPRYIDEVAARFPELTIVAGRPAWPWQAEMIAVLLHKGNVWYELHGWSPRHFTPDLKWEIPRRLKDRVMFGADYPLFRYERLVEDWKAGGYGDEVLEKVFHLNAETFFAGLAR